MGKLKKRVLSEVTYSAKQKSEVTKLQAKEMKK